MPTLLIAYDLAYDLAEKAEVESYLARAIMRLGARWARPMAALWYVQTELSPAQVEAVLTEVIAADDALLVQEITGEAALANTMLRWSGRRIIAEGPNDYADGRVQASHPSPDRLPILPTKVAEAA